MKTFRMVIGALLLILPFSPLHAAVGDFEEPALAPESFYNGSDGAGGFQSGDAVFSNNYNPAFDSWDGFALSNVTDTRTPGFGNQFSAIAGSGVNGSAQYAVGSQGFTEPPMALFATPTLVSGAFFCNTTYAYLSMRDGDLFAKQFGGPAGDDPDWFLLTITGRNERGQETGTVDFYLADYRPDDPATDYLLDEWTWVDLSSLGAVTTLEFTLSSSDVGEFGMNTPGYFAMDFFNPYVKRIGMQEWPLAAESFYNGADGAGGFDSKGIRFSNAYDPTFGSWEGFAVSNATDNTTAGYFNQYSAVTGAGHNNSTNYVVFSRGFGAPPAITLPAARTVHGFYVTNGTYPYLSMRDGDMFAKQFGGSSGEDPDWFLLTITGRNVLGAVTGAVDFYLADYRFDDPAADYLLDDWAWVDLGSLGAVTTLEFTLSSSDVGTFGMNTPAYFCMDGLAIEAPVAPNAIIRANGAQGRLTVAPLEPVEISVGFDPGDYVGVDAEWWLTVQTPFGRLYQVPAGGGLSRSITPVPILTYPLVEVPELTLFELVPLFPFSVRYGFAVDDNTDGVLDGTWADEVLIDVER